MKPALVVMAAGLGSRYGGLKQLERVGPAGETVMDYALFDARRAGIDQVVFVIRRELEAAFRERVGGRYAQWMDVDYAFQDLDAVPAGFRVPPGRVKPWGTAHAVLCAREAVTTPFVVVNADDCYGRVAFEKMAAWAGREEGPLPAYAMAAFRLANTLSDHGPVARGLCRVAGDGHLEAVREWTGLERAGDGIRGTDATGARHAFTGDERVSMNCWGFRPSLFPELEAQFRAFLERRGDDPKAECYLPSVVDTLLREGKCTVRVLDSPDPWFGVTYQEDRAPVAAALLAQQRAGAYPPDLWT